MLTLLQRTLFAASIVAASFTPVQSQERGFGNMYVDGNTPPKSTAVISDPTGSAPTGKVRVFKIEPVCADVKYDDGSSSDCKYNSSRSERSQENKSQPRERWYGWYFYLPDDFPLGKAQKAAGQYTIGQWHDGQCPHAALVNSPSEDTILYVQTMFAKGNYECDRDKRLPVADMRSLVGKWNRIEIFSRWDVADGAFVVFLNGNKVVDFKGRTLTKGYENENYFKYGIYHCCTKGVELISPYEMYYSHVRSAKTREGLQ
jgi:hypothetical protein